MSTLLCFGFGYSAQHHAAGFGGRFTRIIGTTRSAERAAALAGRVFGGRRVEMLVFGGEAPSRAVVDAATQADAVLVSAPPDEDGDPVLGALHDTLAAAPGLRRVVLLSTIGIYGDHAGAWVDETTAAAPTHDRARERVAAEEAWQALGRQRQIPVAILRLGGIYGPAQNALVNVRLGRARNIAKPGQVFNRIHVADIAQAIDAAFAHGADGAFNVTDDAPTPPGDPIVFAARLLGMTPPPEIPFAEAAATMTPMAASFYAENRRVRNERLKRVLGVTLRYPTFREGLTALHKAGD
jgi:nucleoside-diphosphate-sugar epimerase